MLELIGFGIALIVMLMGVMLIVMTWGKENAFVTFIALCAIIAGIGLGVMVKLQANLYNDAVSGSIGLDPDLPTDINTMD